MNRETTLAWILADATAACFTASERAVVYSELGAGENLLAIRRMLAIAVRTNHTVPAKLATLLTGWLQGYVGNEHEPPIRSLLNSVGRQTRPPANATPVARSGPVRGAGERGRG